jgi:hypothetical protein
MHAYLLCFLCFIPALYSMEQVQLGIPNPALIPSPAMDYYPDSAQLVLPKPPTALDKTKKIAWQCCVSKGMKLVVSSCLCGKSCIETATTFSEYKMLMSLKPFLLNPCCAIATVSTAACICTGCVVYRKNLCPCTALKYRKPIAMQ